MRQSLGAVCVAVALLASGCSGSKTASQGAASPEPSTAAPAATTAAPSISDSTTPPATATDAGETPAPIDSASAAGVASPVDTSSPTPLPSGVSPTPTPSPTPDPNLLDAANGTIVRSYPATIAMSPARLSSSISISEGAHGPFVFVFELPGVATISSFEVMLGEAPTGKTPGIAIAVSSTSATAGFADAAAVQANATGETDKTVPESLNARWIRVTLDDDAKTLYDGVIAKGVLQPRPAAAPSPDGIFVEADPYKGTTGTFVPDPGASTDPWYVRFTMASSGANALPVMSGVRCYDGRLGDPYPGSFDGRVWTWNNAESAGRFVANDEGTIVSNGDRYYVRNDRVPKFCHERDGGGKGTNVLVLDGGDDSLFPVEESASPAPPYHFDRESPAMLDPAKLPKYATVILNGLCKAGDFFAPPVAAGLDEWVAAGHKLMIYDSDMCGKDTEYAFLPYPFTTNNPGATGSRGDRLIEVENDQFGTLDATDPAHYFDPKPFAAGSNQLGDANTVTSHDPHWCGHLFGTNKNLVNGFMQMYAPYGKGLIVYGGLDHDDDGNAYFERLRLLELGASVDGNDPCTENVALAFLIEPSATAKFTPGKKISMRFPMELLSNQGWKGRVTLATSGDFRGTISPSTMDVSGGTVPLSVGVDIPASAKPGQYAVLVTGTGSDGESAQATITFAASTPIVKQLKLQRRIRLYGIHFDVDSARIQPRSEPVIKEVAQIMREEPSWRFRIEGHTDSDGGAAHNQVLSQHRAQSVVDDLVKRYRVARSRLVPVGFGLTRPVESNATSAGKALNRRVELVRL